MCDLCVGGLKEERVRETKRDETEEGKSGGGGGGGGLQSRAVIYRYCKSVAGRDVSKTKMPKRSLGGV